MIGELYCKTCHKYSFFHGDIPFYIAGAFRLYIEYYDSIKEIQNKSSDDIDITIQGYDSYLGFLGEHRKHMVLLKNKEKELVICGVDNEG